MTNWKNSTTIYEYTPLYKTGDYIIHNKLTYLIHSFHRTLYEKNDVYEVQRVEFNQPHFYFSYIGYIKVQYLDLQARKLENKWLNVLYGFQP